MTAAVCNRMHRILVAALGIYTLANSTDMCGVCRNHTTITVFDPTAVDGITVTAGATRLQVSCPRCRAEHWNTGHGVPVLTDLGPCTDTTGPLVIVTRPDADSVLIVAPAAECVGCTATGTVPLYRDDLEEALTGHHARIVAMPCPLCRADAYGNWQGWRP